MIRTAILVAASLFVGPLLAQEQFYIYLRYKDTAGTSSRHKLDCVDSKCKVNIKSEERSIALSAKQQQELLGAFQAQSKQFVVATDSASSDNLMKVKLRYDTPKKRLGIELRLPADKPADLTPELLYVIKTHLELDLSKPVLPRSATDDEQSARLNPQEKSE